MTGPAASPSARPGVVVVDAANVVGSVPDGWWRDRVGATERLRDRLVGLGGPAGTGLGPTAGGVPDWARHPGLRVVLVVEGRARGVPGIDTVEVRSAPGSADDAIVDLVRQVGPRGAGGRCLVVTADRGLRARVTALGADVAGPSVLRG